MNKIIIASVVIALLPIVSQAKTSDHVCAKKPTHQAMVESRFKAAKSRSPLHKKSSKAILGTMSFRRYLLTSTKNYQPYTYQQPWSENMSGQR